MPSRDRRSQVYVGNTVELGRLLLLIYIALLLYGSLYPFNHWRVPFESPWRIMLPRGGHDPYSDIVTNLLVYLPFGFLMMRAARGRRVTAGLVLAVTVVGGAFSLGIEYLQAFNPARVSSLGDVALNTSGTFFGALATTFLRTDTRLGRQLLGWRDQYAISGTLANVGLAAIGLWTLSQLTPLVPSLDVSSLRAGLKPVWYTLTGQVPFDRSQAIVYAFSVGGLALLARTVLHRRYRSAVLFGAFVGVVLLLKIPIVSRQISLEAIAGTAAGVVLAGLLRHCRGRVRLLSAAALILGAVTLSELRFGTGGGLRAFNWIPFRGQLAHDLIGVADLLDDIWPFVALTYLAMLTRPVRPALTAVTGALGLGALMYVLEWHQQSLPGRYGDITDVITPVLAWLLPWLHPGARRSAAPDTAAAHGHDPRTTRHHPRRAWLAVAVLLAAAAAAAWSLPTVPPERHVDESLLPKVPPPDQLPRVSLPQFRYAHPRLPAPSPSDIRQLKQRNRSYLRDVAHRARGGHGPLRAVITAAYVDPGSQNLDLLFRRLMALKFQWRGQEQVKPLAMAYDWLYASWDTRQRAALLRKLIEGCNYIIHFIRVERLSPYNVYLYNSPFQALMAGTLASYGDSRDAELPMRFTYHYWLDTVLPVWRQIMGKNGGWHEGNEYVGVGIGQAVYELPAMWRKATGQDLFRSEPELRGFLRFLIYRERPDGQNYHWGDGAFHDKAVPGRIPLAIEYHDKAAYSLKRPPPFRPTSWPWGPLPQPSLYDPHAITRLPLTYFMDGIGMVVMRSGWGPNATYVTFKTGDNYWSHVHLDQGAFTIYKGGALAIDSGLYGPKYNSDHHMDYEYQTIAHNTITVKDPADTVPAPGKGDQPPRPIANDGGQRRVGSGWGVYAAPLDLADWKAHRDIYHTGTMEKVFHRDGLTVAVADVTPAYTNEYSGKGTFTNRTRRVERFWRIFAYDRRADAVVIFDQVQAAHARFRKRWLLHTIQRPVVNGDTFTVTIDPTGKPGHGGGRLEGHVLLPRQPDIQLIGGKGYQFYVDGHNYDAHGKVEARARQLGDTEIGAWRIEVYPSVQKREQDFLTVLLPSSLTTESVDRVKRLEDGNRVGCEIVGHGRTTRWWFVRGSNRVDVEVIENGHSRTYHVAPGSPTVR